MLVPRAEHFAVAPRTLGLRTVQNPTPMEFYKLRVLIRVISLGRLPDDATGPATLSRVLAGSTKVA